MVVHTPIVWLMGWESLIKLCIIEISSLTKRKCPKISKLIWFEGFQLDVVFVNKYLSI